MASYIEGMNEEGGFSGLTWIASGGLVGLLRLALRF